MKVKRMGITEILRRIWLFSANKIKSCECFSKQPTQVIVELNSSLRHIIVTLGAIKYWMLTYQLLDDFLGGTNSKIESSNLAETFTFKNTNVEPCTFRQICN